LLGRIHGLLLLVGRPMTAEEVCERLDISRASASVQLNAILGWGLARRMYLPGDRRQHYLAEPEPWTWFRRAVRVRKEREFDPVIAGLNDAAAEAQRMAQASGDADLRGEADRLAYLLKFVRLFFGGIETFLQIEPGALQAFLKLADASINAATWMNVPIRISASSERWRSRNCNSRKPRSRWSESRCFSFAFTLSAHGWSEFGR